jgi:hypothetical protein
VRFCASCNGVLDRCRTGSRQILLGTNGKDLCWRLSVVSVRATETPCNAASEKSGRRRARTADPLFVRQIGPPDDTVRHRRNPHRSAEVCERRPATSGRVWASDLTSDLTLAGFSEQSGCARSCALAGAHRELVASLVVRLPACPRTHVHLTSCLAASASSSCQRSRLSTGLPSLRQPRFCQPSIQLSLKARTMYCASHSTVTRQGSFSWRKPSMAERNSIRPFVVSGSLPTISRSVPL